jgi:hypothetical protein
MTNTEVVTLLQEARSWLGHNLDCTSVCDECALAARIDAALAGRAEGSTEDVVEWKTQDVVDYPIQYAEQNGAELVVFPNITEPNGVWHWKTIFMGEASTETEAKSAAIAAVRGLK